MFPNISWMWSYDTDAMLVKIRLDQQTSVRRAFSRAFLEDAGVAGFLKALEQEFVPLIGAQVFYKLITKSDFSKITKAKVFETSLSSWFTGDFGEEDFYFVSTKFKEKDLYESLYPGKVVMVDEGHIDYVAPSKSYKVEKFFYQESPFSIKRDPIIKIPHTFQVIDDGEVLLPLFP